MRKIISFLIFSLSSIAAFSQQRFPRPEFETGHVPPKTIVAMPRGFMWELIDVSVFILLLSAISYFILKKRSRRYVIWSGIVSVIYFGIIRQGCVCSIGAIQNVSMALFNPGYIIPLSVILLFILPLIFTFFFGRTFCAGVCFFGAIQELLIFKPIKVPMVIQKSLSVIPYLYLFMAVLLAATQSDFIICRFDPFIGFFRFSATLGMFIFGAVILISSLFIARPYCRFLCPYGVLLNWISRISVWHLTITPAECVQCKLCENSCPIDAIEKPVTYVKSGKGFKGYLTYMLLIPVFMVMGGGLLSLFHKQLASINPEVNLAQEIKQEELSGKKSESLNAYTFNASSMLAKDLYSKAAIIQQKFFWGCWIVGATLGLLLGLALMRTFKPVSRHDFEPHKGNCVSCSRCLNYCPVGKKV